MTEILVGFVIILLSIILFVILFAGLFTETKLFIIINRICWIIIIVVSILVFCYCLGDIILN